MPIKYGYIGYFQSPGGEIIRSKEFNVATQQNPEFYDHIIGLRDTIPDSEETKGSLSEGDEYNTQKTIWRPGVKTTSGTFTFPVTSSEGTCPGFKELFDYSVSGSYFDFSFFFYSGMQRDFFDCRIANFSLNISGGDVINVTVEIHARYMEENTDVDCEKHSVSEKLVTWDEVSLVVPGANLGTSPLQSFNLSITNPIFPIYTSASNQEGADALNPQELRVGMQEVNGVLSFYNEGTEFVDMNVAEAKIMTLGFCDFSTPIKAIFKPIVRPGMVGPVVSTLAYVGIDKPFEE